MEPLSAPDCWGKLPFSVHFCAILTTSWGVLTRLYYIIKHIIQLYGVFCQVNAQVVSHFAWVVGVEMAGFIVEDPLGDDEARHLCVYLGRVTARLLQVAAHAAILAMAVLNARVATRAFEL